MATKIQVVFQGGGARLCSLMAAAEAVQTLQKESLVTVTRVAGTSAGAIAACMLASGRDIGHYREKIIQIGPKYLPLIAPYRPPLLNLYRVIKGRPLYEESHFRAFLDELFAENNTRLTHLDELTQKTNTKLLLFATDILNGDIVIYGNERIPDQSISARRHKIIDVLTNTCAVPFIFRSFNGTNSSIVDGGILENFPAGILIAGCPELGEIVGFSFARTQTPQNPTTILDYAKSLLFAAMDHSVRKSTISLGQGRVMYIDTDIETLDFQRSLNEGLRNDHSKRVQLQSELFVREAVKRLDNSLLNESGSINIGPEEDITTLADLMDRIYEFHSETFDPTAIKINRITVYISANSLFKEKGDSGDDIELELEIEPIGCGIKTFRLGVAAKGESPVKGFMNYRLVDKEGNSVKATAFPVTRLAGEGVDDNMHNLILVFHERLVPNGSGPYRLSIAWTAFNALGDLIKEEKSEDKVTWTSTQIGLIERFEIVCFIPKQLGKICQSDPPVEKRKPGPWVSGQEMSSNMLGNLRPPRPFFDAYGWYAEEVRQGETTGVLLSRS